MSPSDIIEIWRECPHLSQCQIDKLTGAGISVEALSSDPTDWGFALAADHVAFDGTHPGQMRLGLHRTGAG